jgi:hypothetical protein
MADTIRDVVIKIRLEVEKSTDMRAAVEQAGIQAVEKAQTASVARVSEAKQKAAAEQSKAIKLQVEEVRAASEKENRISEAQERFRKIRMQERLAAYKRAKAEELKIEQAAEAAKRGTLASNVAGAYGAASRFVGNTLINVLAAKVVIENANDFLKEFTAGLKQELKGDVNDPGPVTSYYRQFVSNLDALNSTLKDTAGLGGTVGSKLYEGASSGLQGLLAYFRARDPGAFEGKTTRRIGGEDFLDARIQAEQKLASILLERTKAERALIAAEKAKLDAAREEFGLLNADRKEGFKELARRVSLEGIDALTDKEREDLQRSNALRGLLGEKARASADAAGFEDVAGVLGFTKRIAEAQQRIDIESQNIIDVKLDTSEELAKVLEERIAPLIRQRDDRLIQAFKQAIDKSARETATKQNQGV